MLGDQTKIINALMCHPPHESGEASDGTYSPAK